MNHSRNGAILRATATIAKSFYRELRRAEYSHQDVLRLVNEMVQLLTQDAKQQGDSDSRRIIPPTLDRETGLSGAEVMREVVDFEYNHVRGAAGGHLQLLVLDVELPQFLSDGECRRIHETIAQVLRNSVRSSETIGRMAPLRYLVVMPRCPESARLPVLRRLAGALAGPDGLADQSRGVRIWARFGEPDGLISTGAELLERAVNAERQTVFPWIERTSQRMKAVSGERQVTLALGGSLAQAVAHLGVVRSLRRAGVRVAGIAGTNGGALVGAMIASGMSEDTMLSTLADFAGSDLYRGLRRAAPGSTGRNEVTVRRANPQPVPAELYQGLVQWFAGPDREIERLPVKFVATATDLAAGRLVHLGFGSLHRALRASCATPGLFPLEAEGDRELVSGSILAEVPVSAAALLADAPVLAVYLQRPEPQVWQVARNPDVEARMTSLQHGELVREQLRAASIVLPVPVPDLGWLSLREAVSLVEIGEEAAEQALPAILERIDDTGITKPA